MLTKGTFSMRSSASIILAESAILKSFINTVKNLENHESDDYKAIQEKWLENFGPA
jgi:hypothetical protein